METYGRSYFGRHQSNLLSYSSFSGLAEHLYVEILVYDYLIIFYNIGSTYFFVWFVLLNNIA